MNNLIKVKVKETGKEIQVYRLTKGGYCDFNDCKTVYQENELIFIR